jgi:hypothetical protein
VKSKFLSIIGLSAVVFSLSAAVFGQNTADTTRRQIARGDNLFCSGYITKTPVDTSREVVGGEQEQEQNVYSQFNNIFINQGAQQGIKVGDRFFVTRPRGRVRSPFSKKGDLGIYVQQVGTIRIVNVKQNASVAIVENSCETILLGDLLTPYIEKSAPNQRTEVPLNRFKDANGKATGRIVLARDAREMVSRDQIVFVDLGAEDGVKAGDYLTVYRPLGKGNVARFDDTEVARPEDYGFESLRFRGGKFGNQAPRRKGENATGRIRTSPEAKKNRPEGLRKIVGEAVVLGVNERTATVIITRTAQEIHTGDYVEIQ